MFSRFVVARILSFFEKHGNTGLPYSVKIDSGKPGAHLVIFGSVHGNEKVGARLAHLLVTRYKKRKFKLKNGAITFILGNPEAFRRRVRYIDTDLNRSFNNTLDDNTVEGKRAREIREYLKRERIDGILDLHSVSVGNFKAVAIDQDNKKAQDIIKDVAIIKEVLSFREQDLPGSTSLEASRHGVFGLMVECGNHSKSSAIYTALRMTYLVLHKLGMLYKRDRRYANMHFYDTIDLYESVGIIRPGSDFKYMVKNPRTDTPVKKGEPIARTKEHGVQKAEQDCVLLIPTKERNVRATDHDAGLLAVKKQVNISG